MNKKAETFFFSTTGVVAAFAVIILVNFIFNSVRVRVDLTADKVYTLSEGTKNILKNLDTPITIRYYLTRNDPNVPAMIKNYASQVEDLLHEYRQNAPKFIRIQKLDPQPDTEAAESADLDGISGHTLPNGDKFYCGLAFSCLDQKEAIAYLDFNRERLLEYDVSRAISRVMTDKKPVVGVMSALPVMGTKPTMQMMQAGQFQGAPEWLAVTELKGDFEVKEVELTVSEIPEDVDVLVVIHPRGITGETEYALDQFVLRGGKLIAMVDPLSISDPAGQQQRNPMMGGAGADTSSSLEKLFEAWGVKFNKAQVVADREFLTKLGGRDGQPVDNATFLSVSAAGLNTNDIATAQIGSLLLPFAGQFTGTPVDGLSQTVLLHSSTQSKTVEAFLARMQGTEILKNFKGDGDQKSLAIRLSGKFKTAFPDGKPGDPPAADAKDEADKKPASDQLKEAAADNHVVLIADADMLVDQFCLRQMPNPFGARVFMPVSANINLLQNIVEQMAGDSNLINSRSRATRDRRFTVLSKMRDEAAKEQRAKVKELEDSEQEIAGKLRELLGQMGQGKQTVMVDKDLQDKIKKFKEDQVTAKRKLREVKKELRRDIVALENGLKLANILGMPAIVIVIGLLVGLIKRQKTAAK